MSLGSSFSASRLGRLGGRMPADSKEQKDLTTSNVIGLPAVGQLTGVLTLINGCAQGTTAFTRIGRRIKMTSLYIRIWNLTAATQVGSSTTRIIVVYDKQSNATAPVATDILLADGIQNGNNLSNSRRFVTLCDKVMQSIGPAGPQAAYKKIYLKLNHPVEFNTGSAGTIGDIQTGAVYVLLYANGGTTTAGSSHQTFTRIRFVDL